MATNLETIERALRLVGVLDMHASAPAKESEIGLTVLNGMLTRWEANNIPLGFSAQTSLSAALPVPPEAETAVAYNLAVELGVELGAEPPQSVAALADAGYRAVSRDAFKVQPSDPSGVPGGRGRWNINTDA